MKEEKEAKIKSDGINSFCTQTPKMKLKMVCKRILNWKKYLIFFESYIFISLVSH